MKLKSIYLSRANYGDNNGKLSGKIEYDNYQTTVALVLSEEQAAKIVNLVAEDTIRHAKELAEILITDAQASIAPPAEVPVALIETPVAPVMYRDLDRLPF